MSVYDRVNLTDEGLPIILVSEDLSRASAATTASLGQWSRYHLFQSEHRQIRIRHRSSGGFRLFAVLAAHVGDTDQQPPPAAQLM